MPKIITPNDNRQGTGHAKYVISPTSTIVKIKFVGLILSPKLKLSGHWPRNRPCSGRLHALLHRQHGLQRLSGGHYDLRMPAIEVDGDAADYDDDVKLM